MTQTDDDLAADSEISGQQALSLEGFTPYRLAVLSHEVSNAVAQLYSERFNLSRPEWRVLAALGERKAMTAKEISDYSTMDKMQVSRAVARMLEDDVIASVEDERDRRRKILELTAKGAALHDKIVPLALARESFILSALTEEERAVFNTAVDKLVAKARELQQWG